MKKMLEKYDLLIVMMVVKEQGIGVIFVFVMVYFCGWYNGGVFKKILIDVMMCVIIVWFICDFLVFVGLSSNFVYIVSVFIGYIGIDLIGLLIKCFVVKKVGVDDVNQQ